MRNDGLFSGLFGFAGLVLLNTAALYGVAFVMSGFAAQGVQLVIIAMLLLVLAFGVLRRVRAIAWLTFLILLVAIVLIYGMTGPAAIAPNWLLYAIVLADFVGLMCLFLLLWQDRQRSNS